MLSEQKLDSSKFFEDYDHHDKIYSTQ